MTEHDQPTVARATLWLDTSNETETRRSEALEDRATLAFERPREPEREAARRAPAQPEATAVLDRAQLIAAIDHATTGELEPVVIRQRRTRRAVVRSAATHALALLAGVALSAALSAASSATSTAAPRPQPAKVRAAPSMSHQPAAQSPTEAAAPPKPAAAAADSIAEPSQSRAVDALARGDYAAARAEYEALARKHPNDAALAAVAALLSERTTGQCNEEAGSCAR